MAPPLFDCCDTMDRLVAEDKVVTTPYSSQRNVKCVEVSLDALAKRLVLWCHWVFLFAAPMDYTNRRRIAYDVKHMVDFAMMCFYNRLRSVAQRFAPDVYAARCFDEAPVSTLMEFPAFVSKSLQSIGPLQISDGPANVLVIYAPPAGTMENYGRNNARPNPSMNAYSELMEMLRHCSVPLSAIDTRVDYGSFWTTCEVQADDDGLYNVVGTVYPSHCRNDDVLLSLAFGGKSPFLPGGLIVGYITDGQTPNSAGGPAGHKHDVEYYGIQPDVDDAEGASNPSRPQGQGRYVLGRGTERNYTCYLARRVSSDDISKLMWEVLTGL